MLNNDGKRQGRVGADSKLIYYILTGAFLARLVGLTAPPMGVHSWRQADTASIARNFSEGRFNILFPQVDWGGTTSGYTETEFPIYSYAVAALYKIFGVHEFLARLLAIAFSLIAVYFIYRFAKDLWDEKCALWAAAFFAFLPLQIFYSRTIMPESMLMMCLTVGTYYFYRWYKTDSFRHILTASIFISLAVLIKPPSLYLFLPLGYLAWRRYRFRLAVQPYLWMFFLIIAVPFALWYWHAHQLYLETGLTFGIWQSGDKWGSLDLLLTFDYWRVILWEHLARPLAFFGIPILITGLVLKRERKEERFLIFWMVAILVFVLIVGEGNYVHEYYLLPVMVPAALLMGKVYGKLLSGYRKWFDLKQILLLVCMAGMLVSSLFIYVIYFIQEAPSASERVALGNYVQAHTNPDDLIVVVDSNDPTLFYLCHRKGWSVLPGQYSPENHAMYRDWGAGYVVGINPNGQVFIDLNQK